MKRLLLTLVLFALVAPLEAQPLSEAQSSRGVNVITVPIYEDPSNPESPLVEIRYIIENGFGEGPVRNFHLRPLHGKIQAVETGGLQGWNFARGRHGSVSFHASGSTAPSIGPGETATLSLAPTIPGIGASTLVRWYATATGQPTVPPLKPKRKPPSGGSTPTPSTPPRGGTTPPHPPYEGGVIDWGPQQPGEPTTGAPVAHTKLADCTGPCPVVLDPNQPATLGLEGGGIGHPCEYLVLLALPAQLDDVLELDLLHASEIPDLVYGEVTKLDDMLTPGATSRFLVTPLPVQYLDLELVIIVDDDCDGFWEPAWDLVSWRHPVIIE